ncbi:hypothetical protein [Paenibacillus qinlingensis]|uniref:Uncharacterized protein n=1 Tax=Paenibacillus qinlingensis TaxID=1837343 RepID=A0ABU1NV22_9BACL|nr:hypothetical protein [Paenibacillus qinlingensis]MDR6550847.1 hypothetical protein [Paenibacillus qinlingensis]
MLFNYSKWGDMMLKSVFGKVGIPTFLGLSLMITSVPSALAVDAVQPYTVNQMPIGGGGFVTGMIVHPTTQDIVYMRTDVGGAFRLDTTGGTDKWVQMFDWEQDKENLYGVESIAIDPKDPNVVYTALGRDMAVEPLVPGAIVPPSGIYKSTSKGQLGSWNLMNINAAYNNTTNLGADQSLSMGGNYEYRWAGERLAIDPGADIAYFGSRRDGLWKKPVGSNEWRRVDATVFPAVGGSYTKANGTSDAVGITFVLFDRKNEAAGVRTQTIYVGVFEDGSPGNGGVWRSIDGGDHFQLLTGHALSGTYHRPIRAAVDPVNHNLYVTYAGKMDYATGIPQYKGGVERFDGTTWTDITPKECDFTYNSEGAFSYSGVSVDPSDPTGNTVMVAREDRNNNSMFFRSTSQGNPGSCTSNTSWMKIDNSNTIKTPVSWWPPSFWGAEISSLAIDPFHQTSGRSSRVWYTAFNGVWRTDNITALPAASTSWTAIELGHEEVSFHALKSTPGERQPGQYRGLLSGAADKGGFWHDTQNIAMSASNFPKFRFSEQDTLSIDFYEANPNLAVRVTEKRNANVGNFFYSTTNGNGIDSIAAWGNPVVTGLPADFRGGRVAMSQTDPNTIVWVPSNEPAQDGTPTNYNAKYTANGGTTWNDVTFKQGSTTVYPRVVVSEWDRMKQPLAADRVNGKFYYYEPGVAGNPGTFYRSTDNGVTFLSTPATNLTTHASGVFSVKAVPNSNGEVWMSLDEGGLLYSTNAGYSFTKLNTVKEAYLFSFGKGTTSSTSALYLYGVLNDGSDTKGIFRSDDNGLHWTQIHDKLIGRATVLEGDRNQDQVYVGLGGRGIIALKKP